MIKRYIKHNMSRSLLYCGLLMAATQASAQVKPGTQTAPPAANASAINPLPAAYTATQTSYRRTWIPQLPTTDPAVVTAATRTPQEVLQKTEYFDGIGRPLQVVERGASPLGKDLVTPLLYDANNRQPFQYLPYVPATGAADGSFKKNPFNDQKTFYNNATLNPGAAGESVYYEQKEFENSPLNRTFKSYKSGNSWGKAGGNKPTEITYLQSTVEEAIPVWIPNGNLIPTFMRNYGAGTLRKLVTKDENGMQTIEYRDQFDNLVHRKVQVAATPGVAHTGWLSTHYVYDDNKNLTFVIPPLAVEKISANWTIPADIAANLCYAYRYDALGRMIMKQIPGTDSTEMVYDNRNRLVFSRDGNMRQKNAWLATFYDGQNRPLITALYTANTTRVALQTAMNGVSGTTAVIGGMTVNNPLPNIQASALSFLSYTYYDDYSFAGAQPLVAAELSKPQAGTNPYAQPVTAASNHTRGLITGSRAKVLGATPEQWLTTTNYYDEKGRVIQTTTDNVSGGKDVLSSLYDFSGKILSTYLHHRNPKSTVKPEVTVLTNILYDATGRTSTVVKRLNDDAATERIVAAYSYDELGRMSRKRLGVTSTTAQLENMSYEYNLQGWLKTISKDYLQNPAVATSHFGMELSYDYGFTKSQLNGNISGMKWRGFNDKIARAYGYDYDNSGRLNIADFSQQNTNGAAWTKDLTDFSVSNLTYDANGNIGTLTQKGMAANTIITMDQLTYTYQANSNKLQGVADAVNNPNSPLGDFKELNGTGANDYTYDPNGNLISDNNKKISSIVYNQLNLPETTTVTGKGIVRYLFSANGAKLRKITTDNSVTPAVTTTTDYISGLIYKNDSLREISFDEGRIRTVYKTGQPVTYVYDYFVKDHLNNVRQVLTTQTDFSLYTASMEQAKAPVESALFSNVDDTRTNKPAGYPGDQQNQFVAKLNANSKKIGPSIVVKVMAGDTIQLSAQAFYKSTGNSADKKPAATAENILADLLLAFGGAANPGNIHGNARQEQLTPFTTNFYNNDYQHLKEKDPAQNRPDKPKAYLNYVLFDEQFRLVQASSGVKQVKGEPDQLQTLTQDKMPVTKSGFLYVYTSNETPQDVYFDNIALGVISGPVLEETHYYPFGLTMAGISNNALKGTTYHENRFRFNGIEENKDLGIDVYEANLRNLDAQIGRWWSIDPKPNASVSPYAAMENNPVRFMDPLGDTVILPNLADRTAMLNYWRTALGGDHFTFNDKNQMNFTGDINNFNGDQKELIEGALVVMNDPYNAVVKMSNFTEAETKLLDDAAKPNFLGEKGGGLSVIAEQNGQLIGATILVRESDLQNVPLFTEKYLYMDKDNKPVITDARPGDGIQVIGRPLGVNMVDGKPQTVPNRASNVIFHELGHLIYETRGSQRDVLRYENIARRLLGMPERSAADPEHQ